MEYNYLQGFLDARLFILGEDNSQYQNIVATVPVVKKALLKEKMSFISYVLLALDSTDHLQDPLLDEVEEALKRKWPTVRNKFSDQPTTLLRAIIIEALTQIAKESTEKAAIIYLSGITYYTYLKKGQESKILSNWLSDLGSLVEDIAAKEWTLVLDSSSLKLPQLTLPVLKTEAISLKGANLRAGFYEAAMNGNNVTHSYSSSGPIVEGWAQAFSEKASKAVTDALQLGFQEQGQGFKHFDLTTPLNNFFTEFKQSLNDFLRSNVQSTQRLNLRTNLLWWKETLYSHGQQMPYRQISVEAAPIIMAHDLMQLVPSIYPTAVDHFLKETAGKIYEETEKPVSDWVDLLAGSQGKEVLQSIQIKGEVPVGRISLLTFLHLVAKNTENVGNLQQRTGLDQSAKLKFTDLTVYLFHDLQAHNLVG